MSQQIYLIFVDDVFHLPWRHCHLWACINYTWRKPEFENKSLSKKMDRWIIFRLMIVSLLTNNDNSWSTFPIYDRFLWHEYTIQSTVEWVNKTCVAYCTRLAESFWRIRNNNSQKISTGLARHHLQRFSASDASSSTQCSSWASWIGIALALLKQ